jgi:hypothetical protein
MNEWPRLFKSDVVEMVQVHPSGDFPEYDFPIIFFQRLSLSLGLPV